MRKAGKKTDKIPHEAGLLQGERRMIFEENRNIHGFRINEIRESKELRGRTVLMEHVKTGARLFWVDNGAENMVFSVTFRTLPEDDTGVFHILEHSVL